MKRIFGVALLALPFAAVSAQAQVGYSALQFRGDWSITFRSNAFPQAGPWYLYWPLEGHFVAPAPTGYPYWPNPQGLPPTVFGGPVVPAPHGPAYAPPVPTAVPPAGVVPSATAPTAPLQPTSYDPRSLAQPTANYFPSMFFGQPPSYWYDR